MGLTDWSSIADIITAIITLVGIIVSLYLSVKALREIQFDRRLRQMPHLAFEESGHRIPIEFIKAGKRIPGVNPKYVERVFSDLPEQAESVRIKSSKHDEGKFRSIFYSKLRNYGSGPAIETSVTWIPTEIWIGSEKFIIDDKKRSESIYRQELNSMPSIPSHIMPAQEAQLSRLPTFVEKDIEKKITQVNGVLHIECFDVFGQRHVTRQEFHLFTGYKGEDPYVHITFLDIKNAIKTNGNKKSLV